MKKSLLILVASWFIPLASHAQPSNLVVNVLVPHQDFYAGGASYTDTTNLLCPSAPMAGYLYPSNFNGLTRWDFPASIITSTNPTINWRILTTNSATVVAGTYRVLLYTNNLTVPFYDSSDVIWLGSIATSNTNLQNVRITNNFPVNTLNIKSNIVSASISVKIGPIAGNWYSLWLTSGSIKFQ